MQVAGNYPVPVVDIECAARDHFKEYDQRDEERGHNSTSSKIVAVMVPHVLPSEEAVNYCRKSRYKRYKPCKSYHTVFCLTSNVSRSSYHFIRFISSTFNVSLFLNRETIMARPIAASAAATVMIKKT